MNIDPNILGNIAAQYNKQNIIKSLFVLSIPKRVDPEKNNIKIQNEFFFRLINL